MNTIETTRNIFVGVDIQNDFVDGSLAVNEGEEVIAPANKIAAAVRESGGQAVWTRDWHPASTPHFNNWPVHCVADSDGAVFHPDLAVTSNDVVLSKGTEQTDGYSGWEGVGPNGETLETIIAPNRDRVRVFIGGLATDYCVKATALDIAEHFKDEPRVSAYLIRDAVRAVELNAGDGQAALDAMNEAKVLAISSEQAVHMIEETAK